MGKYEVIYNLWYIIRTNATNNGYSFQNLGREGNNGTDGAIPTIASNEPVVYVNWRDVVVWCTAYSEYIGLTPVYSNASGNIIKDSRDVNSNEVDNTGVNWDANGFRRPTEEYGK